MSTMTGGLVQSHTNGRVTNADTPTARSRATYALFPSIVVRQTTLPPRSTTPTGSATSRAPSLSLIPDGHAHPTSFEQMNSTTTISTTTEPSSPSPPHPHSHPHPPPSHSRRPLSSHAINPVTIPTRTSSQRATSSRDSQHSTPRRLSKKHRSQQSLSLVPENRRYPEIDERVWMSQGRSHSQKVAAGSAPPPPPPQFSRDAQASPPIIGADLIDGSGSNWSQEKENILKGPYAYLESHPGKDIRSQLISAFNEWLQVPASSLAVITRVVALLHTASLLIDDVEDNSQLRRGIPVAHSIFGTAQTINSANYVYFCALQELLTLNNPLVIQIYTEELLNLHRGQGMDLFWRDTLTCPTEDDYLEMVGNKTGGLFRLAIKLMCAESPSHNFNPNPDLPHRTTDYVPLVNTIGFLFQILDDYRNLSDTLYTQNKGLCEDLTEGKFSFPIIHAIRSDPNNLVLINILKQKTHNEEVKRYAVQYMDTCGSFSYTRRVLRGLTKKAMQLIDDIEIGKGEGFGHGSGKGEYIRQILEKLRVDGGKHSRGSASA